MDENALLNDELDAGSKLVELLAGNQFEVDLAFWAKKADGGRWRLYVVSPVYDDQGPQAAYRKLLPLVDAAPELGIDPFSVTIIGPNDSIAKAAREAVNPKAAPGPFAVSPPRTYRGMTRYGGSVLGGLDIDAAYIYPPHAA